VRMSSVFYPTFERHNNAEGIKAHATHYCAGCGHGLAHKYLAETIEELGIQDRTVAVSPVGCSVFLYYYFDVGNTQAAHGRAPAGAIGHKVANPDSIVISYQGDGDLASIGLAEIMYAAEVGIPITVIFINNAIYGMTGGQMAPTTLIGMKTATSPSGREKLMGQPLKMSEIIAQMDAPIYVERVALFNARERGKAERAILKALRLQVENKGFAFVEVLAECPTHLKMDPEAAEKWVQESMLPVYPLGVKKDVADAQPWFALPKPSFEPERMLAVVEAQEAAVPRFCRSFPDHVAPSDIALKLAGAGGDGAQTAAMLIAQAGINEGFDATHIPSYGPESRGGTSYADVHVAETEVLSPASPRPHVLVAFNAPSLAKFGPTVVSGGTIVYDSSVILDPPAPPPGVRAYGVPFTEIAIGLGKKVVKNIVALGAVQAATQLFPKETFLGAIREALKEKASLIPMNERAFEIGMKSITN
ncbi:MAG TPA: 2-oxoacid:acceptor oxidoreductase family protein, partial [Thermoanaerobaculia bacterium]|nr:2-oxoacid:acceptor oxidoreductase family protein [Thermoanaerobaculia bacterium]